MVKQAAVSFMETVRSKIKCVDFSTPRQAKGIALIQTVTSVMGLIILCSVLPIVYAVQRQSVLRNPSEYPFLRQFMDNPVSVIIAMYVFPLAYLGTSLVLSVSLYVSVMKRSVDDLILWAHVESTFLGIKLTSWLFGALGFDFSDVCGLLIFLMINILFSAYSIRIVLKISENIKKEKCCLLASVRCVHAEAEDTLVTAV